MERTPSRRKGAVCRKVGSLQASESHSFLECALSFYLFSRAKADRKRYDEQMAKYQPPGKPITRKRNKTGYNMFFSHHVTNLKSNDTGLPAERGSVAR
jgi:hypothetical protein